jgi:hypothetical protein
MAAILRVFLPTTPTISNEKPPYRYLFSLNASVKGFPGYGVYAASKAALRSECIGDYALTEIRRFQMAEKSPFPAGSGIRTSASPPR